jgi:glycosyltransferase involved in cell wall biosynthesis
MWFCRGGVPRAGDMGDVSTSGERVISIAVLTEDPDGPSVRHRFALAAPRLSALGVEVEILPVEPREVRPESFRRAAGADLVVIHRKLFRLPDLYRLRRQCRGRLVYDLDDAVMYRPSGRRRQWSFFRALRFLRTMRLTHLFLAGNDYLVSRSPRRIRVFVRPTPVELDHYRAKDVWPERGAVVGWIGSESTRRYLDDVAPVLADLCARRDDLHFHLIGPEPGDWPGVRVRHVPWSAEGEADALRRLDVGILPLPDDPWTRGKCSFKALQYMAAGVPAVVSPVGMNSEAVEDGVTGYHAPDAASFGRRIEELLDDPELRRTMGLAGRERVRERYSHEALTPALAGVLRSTVR